MRSLNETYVSGPDPQADGVGAPWLQEHLGGDYLVAWSNVMEQPIDQGADMWWSQQEDHAVKVLTLPVTPNPKPLRWALGQGALSLE